MQDPDCTGVRDAHLPLIHRPLELPLSNRSPDTLTTLHITPWPASQCSWLRSDFGRSTSLQSHIMLSRASSRSCTCRISSIADYVGSNSAWNSHSRQPSRSVFKAWTASCKRCSNDHRHRPCRPPRFNPCWTPCRRKSMVLSKPCSATSTSTTPQRRFWLIGCK